MGARLVSLLVRFDTTTRHSLRAVAEASGCSVSQVVRTSVRWWLDRDARGDLVCLWHEVGVGTAGDLVNVRFSAALLVEIASAADELGVERAGVIRCAVRAWLAAHGQAVSSVGVVSAAG